MIYVSMRLMEWIKVLSELVPSSLEALLCIYMLLSPRAGTDRTEAKRLHWRTRNEGLRCRKTPPSWWRLRAPPGHWAWPRWFGADLKRDKQIGIFRIFWGTFWESCLWSGGQAHRTDVSNWATIHHSAWDMRGCRPCVVLAPLDCCVKLHLRPSSQASTGWLVRLAFVNSWGVSHADVFILTYICITIYIYIDIHRNAILLIVMKRRSSPRFH